MTSHADVPPARRRLAHSLGGASDAWLLTGCAIGEVLGMVISTAFGFGNAVFDRRVGWTRVRLRLRTDTSTCHRGWCRTAARVQPGLRVRPLSISTMEIVDDAFILLVPGAISAGLGDSLFWWSLLTSLVIAFAAAVPVNRYLIARGKGHAVMHEFHQH